jgi:IS605 OrfB family transposase
MLKAVKVKLVTPNVEKQILLSTMERFNRLCNDISQYAYANHVFGRRTLQKMVYYPMREKHGLSAQMTIQAIRKVADSYRIDKKVLHSFSPRGCIIYDPRIISVKNGVASILTVDGRLKVPVRTHVDISNRKGEMDLVYDRTKHRFYLNVIIDVPEKPLMTVSGVLGVDLGVKHIATTSDGTNYTSEATERTRTWYDARKAILQSVGTKSAKRRLKKLSRGERRFKTDTNHCISKTIVSIAEGTGRAIALEDLSHIRSRTTVGHRQRGRHHKWAFRQLGTFLDYKARILGVPVYRVNPRDTSRQCSACGYTDKKNRKNDDVFVCGSCGYTTFDHLNAARNIAFRGAFDHPMAASSQEPSRNPPVLTGGS